MISLRFRLCLGLLACVPVATLGGCGGGGSGLTPTPTSSDFAATAPAPLVPAHLSGVVINDNTNFRLFDPAQNKTTSVVFPIVNFSPDGRQFLFDQVKSRGVDGGTLVGVYLASSGQNTGRFVGQYFLAPTAYAGVENIILQVCNNGRLLTSSSGGGNRNTGVIYRIITPSGAKVLEATVTNTNGAVPAPDGSRLYAISGTDLLEFFPNGSSTKLFSSSQLSNLTLNAGGNVLSFVSTSSGAAAGTAPSVVLVNTQTGAVTNLGNTLLGDLPQALSFNRLQVSPDGSQLVFKDSQDVGYLLNLSSGTKTRLNTSSGDALALWLP